MCPSARPVVRPAAWKIMAGLAVIGLVLGVAGVALVIATGSLYVRPPVDLSFGDADAAYGACQGFARAQLKDAGPVTFEPVRRRPGRRSPDGRVFVRAHADTTNAAGRPVDIHVACTMRPLGGERWELE